MAAPSKLSYLNTPADIPFNYTTVIQAASENALLHPNEEILVLRDLDGSRSSLTNVSLYQQSEQLARYLVKRGVMKGDMVALVGPQTLEMAVGTLGIMRAGGIVLNVMVNMSKEDVRAQFQHVHPKFFLVDFGKNNNFLHPITSILQQYNEDRAKAGTDQTSMKVISLRRTEYHGFDDVENLQNILSQVLEDVELPQVYPEDSAIIFSTSGSTSNPKLVCHSHFDFTFFIYTIDNTIDNIVFNSNQFALAVGSIVSNIIRKQTRVMMESSISNDGQNADFLWRIVKEERCTAAFMSTFVISDLLELPKALTDDGFRLQKICMGGQIIDNNYARVLERFCHQLLVFYGCTETLSISLQLQTACSEPLLTGDVGRPSPGVEVRVVDAQDNPIKRNLIGNVQVRSPQVMKEYVNKPELTERVFTEKNWYRTGDIGKITLDGNLFIHGRLCDVFTRGPNGIYPEMVESVLKEMKAIKYVCVVPVPDQRTKVEVCVCYVPCGKITEGDVKHYLNQVYLKENSLGGLDDIPPYILEFNKFPKLWTGKVDKNAIRLQATARLALTREGGN